MGYTFFDTAECYTGTNLDGTTACNEEVVGLGIKGIRDTIPGTRTSSHMKENIEAANIELDETEVKRIDAALDQMNLIDTAAARLR